LVPWLTGKVEQLPERSLFWHFPAYLQAYQVVDEQRDPLFRSRPCSIIRHGDWKLHEYFESGDLELYNLRDDIGETQNLVGKNPEQAKLLHDRLIQWRKRVQAPVPTKPNPQFDAAKESAAITAAQRRAAGKRSRPNRQRKKAGQ